MAKFNSDSPGKVPAKAGAKASSKHPSQSTPTPHAKKPIKWIRYGLIALFAAILLSEWNGTSGLRNMLKLRAATQAQEDLKRELTRKQKELAAEKAKLESDSAYLEKVARRELGMARPDEKVFRYVPTEPPTGTEVPGK